MVPAHFHDVDGDLSDNNIWKILGLSKILQYMENIRIIQNSDSDLVTSCFTCILIGITRSLLLCFVLGS